MQKLGATPAVVDNDRQSRRSFLRDAGGMLAAGAASLPGIGERLAAQEPPSTSIIDAPAEVVTIPPDPRYYNEDGFNLVEELQYTPGPS
ncbi:MAG: twin-arginine translocation signal domain-containing protein, partial [Candidatus Melainabacteria bacterium]|nr:twin-arginine translocation signal domain-containing protein [Candidatus Melainabacteria bacterium]